MNTHIVKSSQNTITQAANLLKLGEIVAFPTETVYGLGARIFDKEAIQKIFTVKGRPTDNPIIAHIANRKQLATIASDIPELFYPLADAFFPGPLTLVVPKQPTVPDSVSAGLSTIAIRMPNHPIALALIKEAGTALVAPSANLSGRPSPTNAQHVLEDLNGTIPLILDGGACTVGIESTVLDITKNIPTILRPGHITKQQLERVIRTKIQIIEKESQTVNSPGLRYAHYQPKTPITIITSVTDLPKESLQDILLLTNIQLLHFPFLKPLTQDSFYANLREADQKNFKKIIILLDDETKKQQGLLDRITRAANNTVSLLP